MIKFVTVLVLAIAAFGLGSRPAFAQEGAAAKSKEVRDTTSISLSAFTFENTEGVAVITLYNDEKTWQQISKAYKKVVKKITGKSMWVQFADLKPGTYALYVLHDENENQKMDMKWLPYPRPGEGVGASNNPKGRPKWDDAKFTVGPGENKIRVKLKYF